MRIAKEKGTTIQDVDVFWSFGLPMIHSENHMAELGRFIIDNDIEVIFIDPLYLSLLDMSSAGMASNLFGMGAAFNPLKTLQDKTGATFVLLHHFKKSAQEDDMNPCQLEDITQSGAGEWARQWILMARRLPYQDDGG